MLSSCVFIIYHQFVNGICCKKTDSKSDMNKAISDFITYAYSNLIWFAFNFVLVFMPVVTILVINPKSEALDRQEAKISYVILLGIVTGVNLL